MSLKETSLTLFSNFEGYILVQKDLCKGEWGGWQEPWSRPPRGWCRSSAPQPAPAWPPPPLAREEPAELTSHAPSPHLLWTSIRSKSIGYIKDTWIKGDPHPQKKVRSEWSVLSRKPPGPRIHPPPTNPRRTIVRSRSSPVLCSSETIVRYCLSH